MGLLERPRAGPEGPTGGSGAARTPPARSGNQVRKGDRAMMSLKRIVTAAALAGALLAPATAQASPDRGRDRGRDRDATVVVQRGDVHVRGDRGYRARGERGHSRGQRRGWDGPRHRGRGHAPTRRGWRHRPPPRWCPPPRRAAPPRWCPPPRRPVARRWCPPPRPIPYRHGCRSDCAVVIEVPGISFGIGCR